MIGKVIIGKSSYHCIAYCLEDKRELSEQEKQQLSLQEGLQHKGRAEVLEYNRCYGNKWELAEQFRDVEKLSRRVEKPVMHLSIRLAPGDQLTNEQWREIGRAAAQEFGLADHQYISVLHKDTQQPHIHLVANRVGYDGKVASDSNSYARMAALCRRLEKEYNLRRVLSPRQFLSQKHRQIPRHDQRKELLKENIREALQNIRTYPDFEKKMQERGYRVEKGRGIAFEDNKKVRVKGSEVGYSLQTIERILIQNERATIRRSPVGKRNEQEKFQTPPQTVSRGRENHQGPLKEKPPGTSLIEGAAIGLGHLVEELMKPEETIGGGKDPWEEEEERRRRKKKGQSLSR
jgi:hypothetical protein